LSRRVIVVYHAFILRFWNEYVTVALSLVPFELALNGVFI